MAKRLVTVDTDTKVLEGVSDPVHSGSLTVEAVHPYIILSDTTTPAKKLRLRYDSYSGLFEIRNITDDIVALQLATEVSGITRIVGTNLSVYNETPQLELYDRTAGGKKVVMENNLTENALILTNITDGIILDQIDLSTGFRKLDLTVEKNTPKVNLKDTATGGKEYRIYSQGGNLYIYDQTAGKTVIKYPHVELHEMWMTSSATSETGTSYVTALPARDWNFHNVRDYITLVMWGIVYKSDGAGGIRLYNATDGVTIDEKTVDAATGVTQEYRDITATMKGYTSSKTLNTQIKGDGTNAFTVYYLSLIHI